MNSWKWRAIVISGVSVLMFLFFGANCKRKTGFVEKCWYGFMKRGCHDLIGLLSECKTSDEGLLDNNGSFMSFAMSRETAFINTDPLTIDPRKDEFFGAHLREDESFGVYLFLPLGRYCTQKGAVVLCSTPVRKGRNTGRRCAVVFEDGEFSLKLIAAGALRIGDLELTKLDAREPDLYYSQGGGTWREYIGEEEWDRLHRVPAE